MPFGFGGHGGSHGGSFGGHGPGGFHGGGRGPGPGSPGPGGRGGIFGLFAHFGFNSSTGSANANQSSQSAIPPLDAHDFPNSALSQNAKPTTALERVDQFLIDYHSVHRTKVCLAVLTTFMAIFIAIASNLAGDTRLACDQLIIVSSGLVPYVLACTLRNLIHDRAGRKFTNLACLAACALGVVASLVCWFLGLGTLRAVFAKVFAFLVGSFISNWVLQLVRRSQELRDFDDDRKSYQSRALGASMAGRVIELLIFAPLAFGGQRDFFWIVWFMVCTFCLATALEFALSFIAHPCLNRLTYYLSADTDQIVQ